MTCQYFCPRWRRVKGRSKDMQIDMWIDTSIHILEWRHTLPIFSCNAWAPNPLGHGQMDWIKFFQKIIIKSTLEGHGNLGSMCVYHTCSTKIRFRIKSRVYPCIQNLWLCWKPGVRTYCHNMADSNVDQRSIQKISKVVVSNLSH